MDKRFGFAGSMMLAAMAFAGMLCPVIAVAADESSSIILAERGKAPDRTIVISATAAESQQYAAEELRDVLKSTYLQGLAEGKFESAEDAAAKFWAEAQVIWDKYE